MNDKILVLRGQFPQHTFDTIICGSDVVVLPYERGAQSGIMAQCFAFGKPVVTSDLLAFKRILEHTGGGVICRTKDDYIKNISNILKDAKTRQTLQANISNYVQNEAKWSRVARKHMEVYRPVTRVPYGKAKYVFWPE